MVVSLFSDADIISNKRLSQNQQWQHKLSQTQHIKSCLQGATLDTKKPWVRNAGAQVLMGTLAHNFIAVGDAACAFDPISSMGIGFALSSGCQAAVILLNHDKASADPFSRYQQDLWHIFEDYLTTHQKIYEKEQRWAGSAFWQRRNSKNTVTVNVPTPAA